MLKLMKYEFRKQMFSKLIILIGIGLLEVYFLFGLITSDEERMVASMGILSVMAVLSLFYAGIESLTVLNHDLKTKQSYMLFLVPQNSYCIIGAKLIAAMLQILLTGALFIGTFAINAAIIITKFASRKELIDHVKHILERLLAININISLLLSICMMTLCAWLMIVMLGMAAIILSTTFLANSKFRAPLSFLLFLVLSYLVSCVADILPGSLFYSYEWHSFFFLGLFYLVVSVLFYFASAWMLEKKVSV